MPASLAQRPPQVKHEARDLIPVPVRAYLGRSAPTHPGAPLFQEILR